MSDHVEDLTINYEEDGVQLIKELDKEILTKGAWATVIFRYQQWNNSKQEYGKDMYTIRRYRKIREEYRQQSKFNISSPDQARKLVEVLQHWLEGAEEE